ncbi:MAG: glycosyltransferase [Saprospiraceae bacterium]
MKKNKRALFITYYWPPAGGIGVLRCLKIIKYIREFGWEPVIYTASDAQYPSFDYTNEKDIPAGVEVLKRPIIEPFIFYKLITGRKKNTPLPNVFNTSEVETGIIHEFSVWVRSNFFIPDARALWIKPSVKFLLQYLQSNPVDVIFTDGPPHTNTMIGYYISEKTGIPWLADFQDPWTQVDYYKLLKLTKRADKKHHHLEKLVLKKADKITIVSQNWKEELEKIGAKNVDVIPWGYDDADFENLPPIEKSNKLLVTHLGQMGSDRNPKLLFKAIAQLAGENQAFRKSIDIRLIGVVDKSVRDAIQEYEVGEYVNVQSQINRKESLMIMKQSQILLLLLNEAENAKGRIPGKLFEYMRSRRPILAFGPEDSDVEKILEETNAGILIQYEDFPVILETLNVLFEKFRLNQLQDNESNLEAYSIRNLTGKIASYFDVISGN